MYSDEKENRSPTNVLQQHLKRLVTPRNAGRDWTHLVVSPSPARRESLLGSSVSKDRVGLRRKSFGKPPLSPENA